MRSRKITRTVLTMALAGLLTLSIGCVEMLVGAGVGSFGLGYLLGRVTTPTVTVTQCFVNGVEVECAAAP